MNIKLFRIAPVAVIASILSFVLYTAYDLPQVTAQHGHSGQNSKYFDTDQFEELTSTSGIKTITSGLISITDPKTQRAYIAVSGNGIRFTCDGTSPTASLGMPVESGNWFQLIGLPDIQNFQFISDDASVIATCHVSLQIQGDMD